MKEHMMEAMKRKRAMIQQHEEDSKGPHAAGQSPGDDELAPASGASKRDALLGKPDGKNSYKDAESHEEAKNETMLGQEGGFNKEVHTSPSNSKVMFHDPKEDTHDPVDLNRHRNMAGDGSNSKYDKMGVDEHKDVRLQSSKMAFKNAKKAEGLKYDALKKVKADMDIKSGIESHGRDAGKDVEDAVSDNEMQKGFSAPMSKVNRSGSKEQMWDQDKEGSHDEGGLYAEEGAEGDGDMESSKMRGKMSGLKGARARLDGFLSKMKSV